MTTRNRRPVISEESQIAALRRFDQSFEQSVISRNITPVMSSFWNSPELVVYPPLGAMELRGFDAVKEYYERFLKANIIRFEYFEAHYQLLGDAAVGWGKWRLIVQERKRQHTTEGRYTTIYGLIGDHWKYVIKHSSVPSA